MEGQSYVAGERSLWVEHALHMWGSRGACGNVTLQAGEESVAGRIHCQNQKQRCERGMQHGCNDGRDLAMSWLLG